MARTKLCNMCGKELGRYDHTNFSVNHTYGYDSNREGDHLELDLCEECLEKLTLYLIDKCKLNPIVDYVM